MPATWDIIGHGDVVAGLTEAVKSRRPAHAYLFTGPAHLGKFTVANRFASALLCEQGTACGTCGHCTLLAAGNHPDFISLSREDKLTIAQVRDLQQTLSLKPHSAEFRVGLVPDAERLGIPAQNALLKLLEEPPAKTVLILTAGSNSALLPTTVSRTREIRFTRPALDELTDALSQHAGAADAVRAASGRPGLALRFIENPESLDRRKQWSDALHQALVADTPGRLTLAKRLAEEDDLDGMFDHWLILHQQALRAEMLDYQPDPAAEELAKLYAPAQLRHNATQLLAAKRRLGYNPNVVLLVEQTLLTLGES